jgi:hypothetical protein
MLTHPRTFRCPNCKEMVNDSMTQCRYCSVPIDPAVAALVADRQEKTNQAYSDANYLRVTAVAMFVFLGLSLIPLVPLVYWGFLITCLLEIILLIRWQIRFANLITEDPDYQQAKRSRTIALIMVITAIPLGFIVRPLLFAVLAQSL